MRLVIYRIPPADDSTHVNKLRDVRSGVSERQPFPMPFLHLASIKVPLQREGVHGLGERAT